jgi:hypothetical protein
MKSLHDTVCHSEMHRHILGMWSNVQDEYEELLLNDFQKMKEEREQKVKSVICRLKKLSRHCAR